MFTHKRPNWISGHVCPDVLAPLPAKGTRQQEYASLLHFPGDLARVRDKFRLCRVRHGPGAVHCTHETVLLS